MKHAIVALCRGYSTIDEYAQLITRNNAIYEQFYKHVTPSEYDVVIFHEGNISAFHQNFIQTQTPGLPILFRPIEFVVNDNICEICPPTQASARFSMGYKNMCYFWAIRFLEFCKEYDYIIRIDDDCVIHKMDTQLINNYRKQGIYFSSPYYQGSDCPDVIVGMEWLFNEFAKNNNLTPLVRDVKCPYTNIMIVNIQYLRQNNTVMDMLTLIEKTNCIFSNRWGDLPIWGYMLSYFVDKKHYYEDRKIVYWHGSHAMMLNNTG